MGKVKNFARFYALLKQLPGCEKETMVASFTKDRTTSLRDMTPAEYTAMCDCMEQQATGNKPRQRQPSSALLKAKRSAVLVRLQKLGVDTTDFFEVDRFCMQERIAGKIFEELTPDELQALVSKLEAILRKEAPKLKGGINKVTEATKTLHAASSEANKVLILTDQQINFMLRNMPESQLLN